ncbi:MAG: ABC-2 transporter permease [Eggerthellaceae bacterium]|nr:ABC-2 transporter permease [Eggerthellaceae bacterium]
MRDILSKEMRLSASVLSYCFIAFGTMFLLPGYPVLCGTFFVTLGIFQSFQNAREANDLVFSALLPIAKADVVKGKYLFTCAIELCGFCVMVAATLVRMFALGDAEVYRVNVLMNANGFALGVALVIFGLFNLVFVGGFFKTAYQFGKPFVCFIVICFLVIFAAEAAHHIPGLAALNAYGTEHLGLQLSLLTAGALSYAALTWISLQRACRQFERIDL